MKLLECLVCRDIVALRKRTRKCACKESSGAYYADGLYAWHKGPSRIIGMRNQDRLASLIEKQIPYKTNYPWFVCLGHVEHLI